MSSKSRTRAMTRAEVAIRAGHADAFLETATDARALHPDRVNVIVSNAVLAGIAAADAICGHTLGECARGESHDEAVRLLEHATPNGTRYANDLRRLIALKTNSQYSPLVMSPRAADDAITWATRLTTSMRNLLRGP